MNFPPDVKYTKDHEWIKVDGSTGTVGITDYAQGELGDVVFVELPGVGKHLEQGKSFGTIEAVKAVSDLYAPVSGEVVEINKEIQDHPESINKDPYGNGWLIKLKVTNTAELQSLLDVSAYKTLIGK